VDVVISPQAYTWYVDKFFMISDIVRDDKYLIDIFIVTMG